MKIDMTAFIRALIPFGELGSGDGFLSFDNIPFVKTGTGSAFHLQTASVVHYFRAADYVSPVDIEVIVRPKQ